MLYLDGLVGLVVLALWIFCIIDVITTRDDEVRNLPKLVWLIIVVLVPTIGSIAWLVAGRSWQSSVNRMVPPARGYPEYERLGRATGTTAETDEEFLRQCRERAEAQRERYREQKRHEDEAG